MKNKINLLFVCGYGVGSSLMLKNIVKKELKKYNINFEMEHTSAGEAPGYMKKADIILVSKKIREGMSIDLDNKQVIEIVNIMDGKGIAEKIHKTCLENYEEVIG